MNFIQKIKSFFNRDYIVFWTPKNNDFWILSGWITEKVTWLKWLKLKFKRNFRYEKLIKEAENEQKTNNCNGKSNKTNA